MIEATSSKVTRKKSKRKKAANESGLRSELSEAFNSRASDPNHVNNLRFGQIPPRNTEESSASAEKVKEE